MVAKAGFLIDSLLRDTAETSEQMPPLSDDAIRSEELTKAEMFGQPPSELASDIFCDFYYLRLPASPLDMYLAKMQLLQKTFFQQHTLQTALNARTPPRLLPGHPRLPMKATAGRRQSIPESGAEGPSRGNIKKYRCDICEKTFSRSNTLVTHKRIHTGEKPFKCEHCGRAFRQPGNLTRHRLTHTTVGLLIKPYMCTECHKTFNRASNLQAHKKTHARL
ncbi:unnamed protein product, partial [Mesorhabditis spiculigera]